MSETLPPLMALEDVKDLLGITSDTTDDQLTAAIDVVSSLIRDYCHRSFTAGNYSVTFYEPRARRLFLPEWPVDEVTAVTPYGQDPLDLDNVFVNHVNGAVWLGNYGIWPCVQTLVIDYVAGYETLPASLQNAVAQSVAAQTRTMSAAAGGGGLLGTGEIKSVAIPNAIAVTYNTGEGLHFSSSSGGGSAPQWANTPIAASLAVLDLYRSERSFGVGGSGVFLSSLAPLTT